MTKAHFKTLLSLLVVTAIMLGTCGDSEAGRFLFRRRGLRNDTAGCTSTKVVTTQKDKAEREYPIILIAEPSLSPTKDRVAFVVVRGDPDAFSRLGRAKTVQEGLEPFKKLTNTSKNWLWVLDLKSQKAEDTRADASMSMPTWNHDGSQIVFVSGRLTIQPSEREELYLGLDRLELSSRTIKSIVKPWCFSPKFSLDGKYLGFVQNYDKSNLFIQDVATGKRELIHKGVYHNNWLWSPDSSKIYYTREGFHICEFDLATRKERVLLSGPEKDDNFPEYLVCSPDGKTLGFLQEDYWFKTIDIKSRAVKKRFKADHYFLEFDWNESGICYLNATADGDRKQNARLFVFDLAKERSLLVAQGSFADIRWVSKFEILVRKGNTEYWIYNIKNGQSKRVFSGDDHRR